MSFSCCATTRARPQELGGDEVPARGSVCPISKHTDSVAQPEADEATLKTIFSPVPRYNETVIKCFSPPICVHPIWLQNPLDLPKQPVPGGSVALWDPECCLTPVKSPAMFFLFQASSKRGWDFSAHTTITPNTAFSPTDAFPTTSQAVDRRKQQESLFYGPLLHANH